jgi:hypothetical protein
MHKCGKILEMERKWEMSSCGKRVLRVHAKEERSMGCCMRVDNANDRTHTGDGVCDARLLWEESPLNLSLASPLSEMPIPSSDVDSRERCYWLIMLSISSQHGPALDDTMQMTNEASEPTFE